MNVLFLGPLESPVFGFLKSAEGDVAQATEPLEDTLFDLMPTDFLVSFGYRHVIEARVLERFPRRAVNLHISYLPWNRGADPNLWSFVDNTPKGVSIHYLDAGIDTGDVIAQKAVEFAAGETLRTSYARLQQEIAQLFAERWRQIREGNCEATKQVGMGSFHRAADREKIAHLLSDGWDTPVAHIEQAGAEWRRTRSLL
jgi:methionyl-tRNA formyltransferase